MEDVLNIKTENSDEIKNENKIKFKTIRKKQLRQRKTSSEDEQEVEESEVSDKLLEMRGLQKLRKRPNGVDIVALSSGAKISDNTQSVMKNWKGSSSKDGYDPKRGGMVNMAALKSNKIKTVDDNSDIGTQFSVETNKRDEDEEMMKYIEEELSKKKRKKEDESGPAGDSLEVSYTSPEEQALRAVPDHLRESSTKRSEEMLSNQMLNGIPEVDLGIEAKIKNIEATEEAKLRLIWEKQNQKDGPSQFVPTNMAVNFVHHNRFNIDHSGPKNKPVSEDSSKEAPEKSKTKKDERATDDYHFEKFKKQFRRH